MKSLILVAALSALIGSSALAQTPSPTNSSQMDAASSRNDQKSPNDSAQANGQTQSTAAVQKIRQELQSAGFTDVKVVAQSFVVQAKSPDGDPVVMTIGPHGMSVFEALSSGNSSSGTVGKGSDAGGAPATTGSTSRENDGAQK